MDPDYTSHGFTGLESSSFGFSAPHLNANVESNLLERTPYARSSDTELLTEPNEYNIKVSEQTELCHPTELLEKLLAEFDEAMLKAAGTSVNQASYNKDEQSIEENLAPEVCRTARSGKDTELFSTEFELSASQSEAFKKQGYEDLCEQPLSVAQPQPSMCPQYLQFKEATANAPQNNFHSLNFTSNVKATSHYPSLVEATEDSVLNFSTAVNNGVPHNSSILHRLLYSESGGNPPFGVSKPQGIGLHLNSDINVAKKNRCPIADFGGQGVGCHIQKNENTFSGNVSFSAEQKKASGIGLHLNSVVNSAKKNHSPIASFGVQSRILKNENTCSGNVSFSADAKDGHESKVITSMSSITLGSCRAVKGKNFGTPYGTKKIDLGQSFNLEKANNLLPKRKRKKNSVNSGDDSKGCNCAKIKCLKLYCDCFASGRQCSESCSCQGCLNNPENAHAVIETRRQIESRDPFAFASKVIEDRTKELPVNNGNRSLKSPSLARHIKGCKCPKSMCMKQYCECFQANVGCSNRCRCKNCGNVHGKRKEHCVTPEVARGKADVGRLEGRLFDYHDATTLRKHISHSELYGQQHNFAPETPSFQYSDHDKDSLQSLSMPRRCLPSPEFDSATSSSPDCYDMFVESNTNMLDLDSCQWQQMNCDYGGTSSSSSLPSRPWGSTNISRLGQLGTGSSSVVCRRSPDTPLIQEGKTSMNCINGSSPNKLVLAPQHGNENEIWNEMNNSLGTLEGHSILKSMPPSPFPPLTPRNE